MVTKGHKNISNVGLSHLTVYHHWLHICVVLSRSMKFDLLFCLSHFRSKNMLMDGHTYIHVEMILYAFQIYSLFNISQSLKAEVEIINCNNLMIWESKDA